MVLRPARVSARVAPPLAGAGNFTGRASWALRKTVAKRARAGRVSGMEAPEGFGIF
jgi:hypothetical protein